MTSERELGALADKLQSCLDVNSRDCIRAAQYLRELARRLPEGFVLVHRRPAMYQQIHRHRSDAKWEECEKDTFDKYMTYHARYGGTPPVRALYAAAPAPSSTFKRSDGATQCAACGGWNLPGLPRCCGADDNDGACEPQPFEPEAGQREGVEAESSAEIVAHYAGLVEAFQRKMRIMGPMTPPESAAISGLIAIARRLASAQQAGSDTFGVPANVLRALVIQWRHNAQGCGRRDQHAAGTWRGCARDLESVITQRTGSRGEGE